MQITKIAAAGRELYALSGGRLWQRGYHDNWDAITPKQLWVVDVAVGATTESSDDTGGGTETVIHIHVLTRDGQVFGQGHYGDWGEIK